MTGGSIVHTDAYPSAVCTFATMSTLTVTIIQHDISWEDKAANLQALTGKIESIREKTEIVVLPEMFSTGFSMRPEVLAETMDGNAVEWMKKTAAAQKIILTGSLIIEENGNYYNRAIWMLPNGQLGTYDKRHLFAYAGEDKHFTSGSKRLIASAKGWRITPMVCYDLRFPVWARQQSTENGPEYDLLIYMANWPSPRVHAWRTLLQARAIENQCFVIGLNRSGKDGHGMEHPGESMIVGPLGEVLYHAPATPVTHTVTLDKEELQKVREKLPFWKDADDFQLL